MYPSSSWGSLRVGGTTYSLSHNPCTIGRDQSSCDLVIADPSNSISRQQARFYWNAGRVEIENLSHTNPTHVRGQLISGRVELHHGDHIRIGSLDAEFLLVAPPAANPGASMLLPCVHCSQPMRSSARFCPRCGRAQTPAAPPLHSPTRPLASTHKLVVRRPGQARADEYPLGKSMLTLGRAPDNDLWIDHPFISAYHAQLIQEASAFRIVDQNSTNGLLLNGARVQNYLLKNNDVIRIGDPFGNSISLTFVDMDALAAGALMHLNLTQPVTLIGRDPQATLPVDAATVSWHHARIQSDAAGHTIIDLNSTNGTYVSGVRVRQHRLNPGEVIQIGPYQLAYDRARLTQSSVLGNVRLDAIGLRQSVPSGHGQRLILNNVSLSVNPREFVALVGGSGAGKSTLMNALSGYRRVEGRVLLNGADYYQHFEAYRALLGYVPQDDIIHRGLSVGSALRYAAELRLPPDASQAEIQQRIAAVLNQVEIARQSGQLVSSLSGGQRKRVSIAVELLAQPMLFFLDEPTSGLDPGLEKKMMYTLHQLADAGQTIVLVTHATANIDQCDLVAFMSRGRLVFYGPPNEAKTFFNAADFSDIYTSLEQATVPNDPDSGAAHWEQQFQQSPYYREYVAERLAQTPAPPSTAQITASRTQRAKASPLRQWWILTRRQFDLIFHDHLTLFILLAVMPLIGFLVLLIAKEDSIVPDEGGLPRAFVEAQRLLFMIALAAVLLGVFAGAYEIVREQAIFKRERMVNLRVVPYVLSKIGALALFSLIQSATLLFIISLRVKLPEEGALMPGPLEMYITLVLATVASIALGLLLSALAKNENMVIYIILLVLFVQILFAGAIFDLPQGTKPISWLTTTHWSLDALGSTADLSYFHTRNPDPNKSEKPAIDYDKTGEHVVSRWLILIGFAVGFSALTCVRMRFRDER